MDLIEFRRVRIGAFLWLLAIPGAAQKPVDLTAVLTRIQGQVTLSSNSRAGFRSVRYAVQRQVIRRGEAVHVPAGARVEMICSTETLVSLKGPTDWVLDAANCGQGLALPESSYRNMAPQAGRLLPRNGILLLEFDTRNWEGNPGPVLLSPRDTAVMDPRPPLVWLRVPDAVEYDIELRGAVEMSIRISAKDLPCGPGPGPWRDLEVCTWVPSGGWPALEPEKLLLLKIGSRQTPTASLRRVREAYRLHLLAVPDQSAVRESLERIASLPLDKASLLLLSGGVYAQEGLYADAIATYDKALREQNAPEVRVTLGDLYLASGLPQLADREYRQVLTGAPDPAARAAAGIGLGQVAYSRKLFSDARAHFERARETYVLLGMQEDAEIAQAAAAKAESWCNPP